MPRPRILDIKILEKIAKKLGKKNKAEVNKIISARARKLRISSEAVLVILAKELNIGTAVYQRRLAPNVQEEIRATLPVIFTRQRGPQKKEMARSTYANKSQVRKRSVLSLAIEYLLQDEELKDRCGDLLRRPRNFDRVFREATTVLEDRLRRLSGVKGMKPLDLTGKVLSPNPQKAILVVSDEKSEQDGFYSICKGVVLSFRDPTHHELSDKFNRIDALKFCSFIDSLLSILNQVQKHPERL